MNDQLKWIERKLMLGKVLLVSGILLAVVGIALRWLGTELPFNERIITGLGILLVGLGIAQRVRYGAAKGDKQAARRIASEARDERMLEIRGRAGHRAFLVSIGLSYTVLMWLSFADNGSLPPLTGDPLWFAMAVVVLAPMAVYIGSMIYDNAHR